MSLSQVFSRSPTYPLNPEWVIASTVQMMDYIVPCNLVFISGREFNDPYFLFLKNIGINHSLIGPLPGFLRL